MTRRKKRRKNKWFQMPLKKYITCVLKKKNKLDLFRKTKEGKTKQNSQGTLKGVLNQFCFALRLGKKGRNKLGLLL